MDTAYKKLADYIVDGVLKGLSLLLSRKPVIPPEYFDVRGAAQFTSFTEKALRDKIANGEGPKFFRPAPRAIRIKRADLIAWLEAGGYAN